MATDADVGRLVDAIINVAMIRVASIVSVAAALQARGIDQPTTMEVARKELFDALRAVIPTALRAVIPTENDSDDSG